MKLDTQLFLFGLAFVFVVFVFCACYQTVLHEQIHKQIYAGFGVDSEVELHGFGFFGGFCQADAVDYAALTESERMTVRALQANNEIYGYQVGVLINAMCSFAVLGVLLICVKK